VYVIFVLWLAFFIINFNVALIIPLLPYMQDQFHPTATQTGWLLAAFPVVALFINVIIGPYLDRYGRKRFMLIGSTFCVVTLLLTASAQNVGLIIASRAATGVFMPMIGASIFAALADYVPLQNRTRASGYITSAAPVAFLFSITNGIVSGGFLSWRVPIILLAVLCGTLAAALVLLPALDPAAISKRRVTLATYRDRLLSQSGHADAHLIFASYFCWATGVYVFLGLYPSWLIQHALRTDGVGTVGTVVFIGEIGGLFGALYSGRLAERFKNPLNLCALASVTIAIVVLTIPLANGIAVYQGIAYGAFALGRDLMLALILGHAMRLVSAAQRGTLNASLNAIYQTGGSIGGFVSARLYSMSPSFVLNSFVACMAFIAAAAMLRHIARTSLEQNG
jgi:predicted MFS family arabinose efflux permease